MLDSHQRPANVPAAEDSSPTFERAPDSSPRLRVPMQRAIVLAAGRGSRLVGARELPKPLKPVGSVPLLVRILRSLQAEGVREAVIVVGDRGEHIRHALATTSLDLEVSFVENPDYHLKNGVSLLRAAKLVDRECVLTMADHLYAPELVRALQAFDMPAGACALGVDYDIARCFDIDDATKVCVRDGAITAIGKELPRYDCIDTGVFRIGPALVEELGRVFRAQGDCSLSEGVGALAARGKFLACDVGAAPWIDVDTPEACAEAERLVRAGAFGSAGAPEIPPSRRKGNRTANASRWG
jgi:1L-myo-inositol 1-phosphate cytidylyltransferase